MPKQFLPKVIPNENKEETAIRQQLSLEKCMAEINLRKKCYDKLTLHWITTTVTTQLWESDCQKEQQKSVTTLWKENLNKQMNKAMIIITTEEHKMV